MDSNQLTQLASFLIVATVSGGYGLFTLLCREKDRSIEREREVVDRLTETLRTLGEVDYRVERIGQLPPEERPRPFGGGVVRP